MQALLKHIPASRIETFINTILETKANEVTVRGISTLFFSPLSKQKVKDTLLELVNKEIHRNGYLPT